MNEPDAFIATITNDERTFEYDMELPAEMPVSELSRQILMILRDIHGDIFTDCNSCCLECNNCILKDDDTLLKAGAFDGSRIVIRSRQ